jgi:cytochrome P450 family 6
MRFGLLQTKVGLVTLLSKNRIEVSNKTSVPLKYDTKTAIMTAAGGIWLKIVKRK